MKNALSLLTFATLCSGALAVAPAGNGAFESRIARLNALLQEPALKSGIQTTTLTVTGPCRARYDLLSTTIETKHPLIAKFSTTLDLNFAKGIKSARYVAPHTIHVSGRALKWSAHIEVAFGAPLDFANTTVRKDGTVENTRHEDRRLLLVVPAEMQPAQADPIIAVLQEIGAVCGDSDKVLPIEERPFAEVWELAEKDDPSAVHTLCFRYKNGTNGAPLDYAHALQWCTLGATRGVDSSQLLLGEMYYLGQGVKTDYPTARKWYEAAADQGQSHALFMLYLMHEQGQGVERNSERALVYLRLAAANGSDNAKAELARRGL